MRILLATIGMLVLVGGGCVGGGVVEEPVVEIEEEVPVLLENAQYVDSSVINLDLSIFGSDLRFIEYTCGKEHGCDDPASNSLQVVKGDSVLLSTNSANWTPSRSIIPTDVYFHEVDTKNNIAKIFVNEVSTPVIINNVDFISNSLGLAAVFDVSEFSEFYVDHYGKKAVLISLPKSSKYKSAILFSTSSNTESFVNNIVTLKKIEGDS